MTKMDCQSSQKFADVNITPAILHQKIPSIRVLIFGNIVKKTKNVFQKAGLVPKNNALEMNGIFAQSLKSIFQRLGSAMDQSNVQ